MRNDIKNVYGLLECHFIPVVANPDTRYAYFLAQVMPKFTGNFGMTFAKKWTYRAPEIRRNGNESTFRQNIGHSESFPANNVQISIFDTATHVQIYTSKHMSKYTQANSKTKCRSKFS